MSKKYKLVNHDGSKAPRTLKQIEALRDIPNIGVRKGDLGGFVESENNLSQNGDCWVGESAQVYGKAQVYGSAWVYGEARVSGSARVHGSAWVYGEAQVYGSAQVSGLARIESSNNLLNIITFKSYPITITRDNITIGCQTMKREEWLKITEKESIEMGLPKGLYKEYKAHLKHGFKIVKERK